MMTWDMKFRDDRGMTMTELAISLAIMAALSLFLGSELQAMANRVFLDAAASEAIGDLQYARSLAVWERQAIQVIVNVEQPGITLYRAGDLSHPLRPTRNLKNKGVQTVRSTGGNVLTFSSRGTSATATTLTLVDREGMARVMTVSLTGIVRSR